MDIKNVTIAGGGVLGSQIAWMIAFHGFNVSVYDKFEPGIKGAKELHKKYAEHFKANRGASQLEIEDTFSRLNYTTNLAEAVKLAPPVGKIGSLYKLFLLRPIVYDKLLEVPLPKVNKPVL